MKFLEPTAVFSERGSGGWKSSISIMEMDVFDFACSFEYLYAIVFYENSLHCPEDV